MRPNPTIQNAAIGLAVAGGLFAGLSAFASDTRAAADSTAYADRPQLVRGYRAALGLKPSEGAVLGRGSATTQLLARYAQTHAGSQPLVYSLDRVPPALGLRGTERGAGIMFRGGERWTASFEVSSADSALTASRRTALLGQIHAPLTASVGVSAGIRYSYLQTPAFGSVDSPFGNGYVSSAGRADAAMQQLGYQLQLNYLYGERSTVALTYNSRRELEQYRLGSDPSAPDGSQLSVTGEHWFSPSWALRYDIPTPDSGSLMRRQGLRLGVHYRF